MHGTVEIVVFCTPSQHGGGLPGNFAFSGGVCDLSNVASIDKDLLLIHLGTDTPEIWRA